MADLDILGPVQPKKIDGSWRFPLDLPLPDKAVRCPRCGEKPIKMSKRTPAGKPQFICKGCNITFFSGMVLAYCNYWRKEIRGADCQNCKYIKGLMAQKRTCPYFKTTEKTAMPEGYQTS